MMKNIKIMSNYSHDYDTTGDWNIIYTILSFINCQQ